VAAPVVVKIEPAPLAPTIGSSSDLLESMGIKSDAPLCMTCGVKMRMSGACFVCEGCGNTSGCS
jgi:ribonucleoside-diphosphate reductase alpha chain